MAKKQDDGGSETGPWQFGDFLKQLTDANSVRDEQAKEDFGDVMQRAAERYFLPKRMERLEKKLKRLDREGRGRLAGKKPKYGLRFYIRAAKHAAVNSGNRDYSQMEIAESVDRMLAKKKTNFSRVCPSRWQPHAPRLFADVFRIPNHPLLKLAKPYISRTTL